VIFKPKHQTKKLLVQTVAQIYDPRKVLETSNKWEIMATINTTKNYDKSFELLRAAIVDIERGSYLPNLDLCKKALQNLKVTTVRFFLTVTSIFFISEYFFNQRCIINIDEKILMCRVNVNKLSFALLTFEKRCELIGKCISTDFLPNQYNTIISCDISSFIMGLNNKRFEIFLQKSNGFFLKTAYAKNFFIVVKKAVRANHMTLLKEICVKFSEFNKISHFWEDANPNNLIEIQDFKQLISTTPLMEIEEIRILFG
jgi:DNA-binding XRE family transcriptional regulator